MNPLAPMFLSLLSWTGQSQPPELARTRRSSRFATQAMNCRRDNRVVKYGSMLTSLLLAGCGRAPTFDVVGSFFPAWLFCLAVAVLLTVIARWFFLHVRVALAPQILIYPSLTAACAFAGSSRGAQAGENPLCLRARRPPKSMCPTRREPNIRLTILLLEAAGGPAPHPEAVGLQRDDCIRG